MFELSSSHTQLAGRGGSRSAGKGGKRGGHPSNVLQDHFSNSPNSDVNISGGGGKADDLGNYNSYENKILQSCDLNCIFPRSVRH